MACTKCSSILEDTDNFCDSCGTPTAVFEHSEKVHRFLCLHCGTPLKRAKNYCISCGQKVPPKYDQGRGPVRNWIHSPIAKLALLPVPVFLFYMVYVYEPSTHKPVSIASVYNIRTVVEPGEEGSRNQLRLPAGIAMDQQGNVYIADAEHHRILKMDAAGVIFPYAGTGKPGFSGDNGPAYAAQFLRPTGLAVDFKDHLYIADSGNHRVRRISPDGKVKTIAGSGPTGDDNGSYMGDGSIATRARLSSPSAVYTDQHGNIYIIDSGNQRLRRLEPIEKLDPSE